MILYNVVTESPASALELLDIACLATTNLGLCQETSPSGLTNDTESFAKQNLLWTVLYFDMYLCGLLAKPTFIDVRISEAATAHAVRDAAKDVTACRRMPQNFILRVGLAMQLQLFKLMRRCAKTKSGHSFGEIRALKKELEDWDTLFKHIFPQDEVVKVVARYANERGTRTMLTR